jgi:tetratricopeptide (TPR) repeat protein
MNVLCVFLLAGMISVPVAPSLSESKEPESDPELRNLEKLILAGEYSRAEPALEAYVAAKPLSSEALYQLGYVYYRLHKIWPAVKVLSKSLSMNVKNAEAHKILGLCFTILERLDLAQKELAIAVDLNPGSVESHYSLGRVHYELGSYLQAAEEMEKALKLDPTYLKAYHNLGLTYEALGDLSRARDYFVKAIALNEKSGNPAEWPYIDFASFCNRRGEYKKALELLTAAPMRASTIDQAHFQRAKAYRGLAEWEACVEALKKAIDVNPSNPEFYYSLAQAWKRLGRQQEAAAALEKFEKVKENQPSLEGQDKGAPPQK